MTEKLLTMRQVLELVPMSRTTWLIGVAEGRFPKQIKLGTRAKSRNFWRLSDIEGFLNSL